MAGKKTLTTLLRETEEEPETEEEEI